MLRYPRFDLNTLDGTNGFVINGINAGDVSGRSVSGAGDVNGDGIDDLIDGAPREGASESFGESYVVLRSNSGFSSSLDLSTLNGSNGFVVNGINNYDYSGSSVSGAGDVNGDGIDDLIIGAYRFDEAGESYVVFGRAAVPDVLKGDVDMDGDIDFSDIAPFIAVLQSGVF